MRKKKKKQLRLSGLGIGSESWPGKAVAKEPLMRERKKRRAGGKPWSPGGSGGGAAVDTNRRSHIH